MGTNLTTRSMRVHSNVSEVEMAARTKILAEIAGLEQKLDALKQEMILTDGAIQAFKWVIAELDKGDVVDVEVVA